MPYQLDITERLHQRMLDIVRTGLPLITHAFADADLRGLAHLREEMVEAIDLYCRHVHRVRENDRDAEEVQRMVDGCLVLRHAYEAFRRRWEHRNAHGNWHEYRLSAVVMMKQVRAHVEQAAKDRSIHIRAAA